MEEKSDVLYDSVKTMQPIGQLNFWSLTNCYGVVGVRTVA